METKKSFSSATMKTLLRMQQAEITGSASYGAIAGGIRAGANKETLMKLAREELGHYETLKRYTGAEMKPQRTKVFFSRVLAKILGFTFVIKQMEKGEGDSLLVYKTLAADIPELEEIARQEKAHEDELMDMLDEERLQYVGSMVLGMNDALVELTGTIAGLTLALRDTRLVALSGLITGISATLSMASSEFLSARSEGRKDALRSSIYTGIAYLITVAVLILPYLLFGHDQSLFALVTMLGIVVLVILAFNYYISVAKGLPFKKRFFEMAGISLGVAALSFVVGLLAKQLLGVDI